MSSVFSKNKFDNFEQAAWNKSLNSLWMFKSSKMHLDFGSKSFLIKLISFMETDMQLQQISVMVSYLLFFFKEK